MGLKRKIAHVTAAAVLVLTLGGFQSPAAAVDLRITNVSAPPHFGAPTVTFDATGAVAKVFKNCYEMAQTLGPIVKLSDDQGARTLQISASWGLTATTIGVLPDGLRCSMKTADWATYKFSPDQLQVAQTFQLVFGLVSAAGTTVMLNGEMQTTAPEIVSPTRGETLPGFVTLEFSGDLDPRFKVLSREISVFLESASPLTYASSFDEPLKGYLVLDSTAAEGKPVEIRASWTYKNPAGVTHSFARSVKINIGGSGLKNPVSTEFITKIESAGLSSNLACTPPTNKTKELSCSINPRFFNLKSTSGISFWNGFSAAYKSTVKIQTSLDGKSWKTYKTIPFSTGLKTNFTIPFSTLWKKFYVRTLSNGIAMPLSPVEFQKYFGKIKLY